MTMISRVFGLLRDIVIALLFGAGAGTDAFFIAFKIPNYLRRLFAEGGFSQAFVPILSEYKNQRDQQEVKRLVDHVGASHIAHIINEILSNTGVKAGMAKRPYVFNIPPANAVSDINKR